MAATGKNRLYQLSRWLLRWLQSPAGGVVSVGLERFPESGPVILAVNHVSFLDPIMAGLSCVRPLHFMARASLFDTPVFGQLIGRVNAFPVEREGDPRAALRACGEHLDNGEVVLMFPEGTRSRTGRLGEIKGGVGLLASRHRAAVLPLYLWGTRQAWPAGRAWMRPHPVRAFYGRPLEPAAAAGRDGQRRVTEYIKNSLLALEAAADAWTRNGARPDPVADGE